MARAEKIAGNTSMADKYCSEAARLAENVADLADKELLLKDLATIK